MVMVLVISVVLFAVIMSMRKRGGGGVVGEPQIEIRPSASVVPQGGYLTGGEIEPIVVPDTKDWKTFESGGFSFKYPETEKTEFREKGDTVVIIVLGSTQVPQAGTYDGVNVAFLRLSLGGRSIEEKVEEMKENYSRDGIKINVEPRRVELGGREGYYMEVSAFGGRGEYYFPLKDDSYLKIEDMTSDPNNLGYEKIVEKILETVKF